jgi:23S rRNA (cytidine1920-2'-O)/16S rRNA (cytidine1409-2'-O)-methyltransferase
MVDTGDALTVLGPPKPFVSRAGAKLAAALQRFGVDPAGRECLDAGASTGGFTDCLLKAGAARVIAVDVGYGQLDWNLRNDPRVTVMDRTNVRELKPEMLPYRPSLVVADLSFISLKLVLRALSEAGDPDGDLVLLVKPQFEAPREQVGKGGVVRDPLVWAQAIEGVCAEARSIGLGRRGVMASPVRGPAGNVEFLVHLERGEGVTGDADIRAAVQEGEALA